MMDISHLEFLNLVSGEKGDRNLALTNIPHSHVAILTT
jgi:hypothetical protein